MNRQGNARYMPVEPIQEIWGLHVLDCGYTVIPPGTSYPPGTHPKDYTLKWNEGRVLAEYQMVYITEGNGTFESTSGGRHKIKAGTVFLLFPGEWHRYRPDFEIGWNENWIGFNGSYAKQLMVDLFSPKKPVLQIGFDSELIHLIRMVSKSMEELSSGYREIISGYTIAAISRLRGHMISGTGKGSLHEEKMGKARSYISENAPAEIDLQSLARQIGMSYSGFRSKFKSETGLSPRQFQLQIRINRAKDMLRQTNLSISEISDILGFCSLFYFSRIFRNKTGSSPNEYRKS